MICFEQLDSAWASFSEAAAQSYQIGPFVVRICALDATLVHQLLRACRHLEVADRAADLTIRIWSGAKLPSLNWSLIGTNGYRGYADPPFYFHHFEEIGALSALDATRHIAYYIIRDPSALPWWVSGSPLQVILHAWFREKGLQLTHSAAITNGKKAILLAGPGGSGKSTTVLACLQAGLNTLGEDYILLGKDLAYSVYQTAKWHPHTRTLFPSYESRIVNRESADREKALIYYEDLFPSQIELSSPLHAVASLRVGTSAQLQPADLRTSLQSLLLSTAMQLPHSNPRTMHLMQKSLEPLAHFRLSLGPDLRENVALLRSLFV
jgi:hypothetical protein